MAWDAIALITSTVYYPSSYSKNHRITYITGPDSLSNDWVSSYSMMDNQLKPCSLSSNNRPLFQRRRLGNIGGFSASGYGRL